MDAYKLTVLVTPFENLSGDPSQEHLSDGLTDEMITRLGQTSPSHLSVIARSTLLEEAFSEHSGNDEHGGAPARTSSLSSPAPLSWIALSLAAWRKCLRSIPLTATGSLLFITAQPTISLACEQRHDQVM
jgi:hypothetical protein